VPLRIFSVRSVSAANSVGLLAFAAIFPFFFFLSLFLQQVLQYDALKTGFAFLPFSVSIIATAILASQAVPKIGVRKSAMIGTGAAFLGMAGFGLFLSTDLSYFPGVFVPMVFLAVGMGMTFVPLTFLATSKVPASEAGLASGLFNTTQQVGGALGLAILATLANDRYASALADKSASAGIQPPTSQAALAAAPPEVQVLVAESLVQGWSLAFLIGAGLIVLGFIAGLILIHDEDADLEAGPAHIG
jgi:predicted MFS family arabinose efflux permease